jgi:hypothetical protein
MNINKATQPALLCALLLCVLAVYQFHTTHAAHAQAITSTDNNDPPPPPPPPQKGLREDGGGF